MAVKKRWKIGAAALLSVSMLAACGNGGDSEKENIDSEQMDGNEEDDD